MVVVQRIATQNARAIMPPKHCGTLLVAMETVLVLVAMETVLVLVAMETVLVLMVMETVLVLVAMETVQRDSGL